MKKNLLGAFIVIILFSIGIYSYLTSDNKGQKSGDQFKKIEVIDKVVVQKISDKDVSKIKFEAKGLITKLNSLNKCFTSSCDFPDTDPRSYELALNQEIKKNLNVLYEKIAEIGFADPLISKVARHYLKIGDGFVKESALEILSTQPPSEENFNALDEYVFNYHDPLLIVPASKELEKYLPDYSSKITVMLAGVMDTGSLVVKEAVAQNISPFVNSTNIKKFEAIKNEYQKGSKIWYSLSQALEKSNIVTQ